MLWIDWAMTGNFERLRGHLSVLRGDIYGQPEDHSHTAWAKNVLNRLLPSDVKSVLDVGCGQGFLAEYFASRDVAWTGVTLGDDAMICRRKELKIVEEDVSFLSAADNSYDLVFARHILEHSPMPIPTLMEWRRVSKKYLLLIAPAPDFWGIRGRNHYSVVPYEQLRWWLDLSGWKVLSSEIFNNHHSLFLKHWRVELIKKNHLDKEDAPTHFPLQAMDVEYRILCRKGARKAD
jgi:SAM-dependent methyltransferase